MLLQNDNKCAMSLLRCRLYVGLPHDEIAEGKLLDTTRLFHNCIIMICIIILSYWKSCVSLSSDTNRTSITQALQLLLIFSQVLVVSDCPLIIHVFDAPLTIWCHLSKTMRIWTAVVKLYTSRNNKETPIKHVESTDCLVVFFSWKRKAKCIKKWRVFSMV